MAGTATPRTRQCAGRPSCASMATLDRISAPSIGRLVSALQVVGAGAKGSAAATAANRCASGATAGFMLSLRYSRRLIRAINGGGASAMREYRRFYIDGAWMGPAAGRPFEVVNPATEAVIAVISLGDRSDVDRAVAAARRAFD